MPPSYEVAQQFLSDIIDKVLIIAGAFFLVMTVLFFSPAYQWVSMVFLLLGVTSIIVGIVLRFESFELKIPSLEGWGTISICASAILMASAVGVALYAVAGRAYLLPAFQRAGGRLPAVYYKYLLTLVHPTLWLTPILAVAGIALLTFGLFLKFYRDIF